jgi:hypothetical protein
MGLTSYSRPAYGNAYGIMGTHGTKVLSLSSFQSLLV